MFKYLAISLLAMLILYSCSKDKSTPASEIVLNNKVLKIDSVALIYKGDGIAWCYFVERDSQINKSSLILGISDASFEKILTGNYHYKKYGIDNMYFTIISLQDSILDGSLTISSTSAGGYSFDLTVTTDSTKYAGYAESSSFIKDLAGRMYIKDVRYEAATGAIATRINADTLQLNVFGSKTSFPQIAFKIRCRDCQELPVGDYNLEGFENVIKAKFYMSNKRSVNFSQGYLSIYDSAGVYQLNYTLSFSDTIVEGFYYNPIIFQ